MRMTVRVALLKTIKKLLIGPFKFKREAETNVVRVHRPRNFNESVKHFLLLLFLIVTVMTTKAAKPPGFFSFNLNSLKII